MKIMLSLSIALALATLNVSANCLRFDAHVAPNSRVSTDVPYPYPPSPDGK
jgi:hypothetical protein